MRVDPTFLLLVLTLTTLQPLTSATEEKDITKVRRMNKESFSSKLRKLSGGGGGKPEVLFKQKQQKATVGREFKINDMWLNEDQMPKEMKGKKGRTGGLVDKRYRWPERKVRGGKKIPTLLFKLAANFTSWERRFIKNVVSSLKRQFKSCIRFKQLSTSRSKRKFGFVNVYPGEKGCSATAGYRGKSSGKTPKMSLKRNSCFKKGKILHEFLHALGVYHTQSRRDRDKYVTIYEKNIEKGKQRNFKIENKLKIKSYGVPYDFLSIMHYPGTAFS